jgi:hypothetical protein
MDSEASARQQQPGAVVVQRDDAVDLADDIGEFVDIDFELQTAGCLALQKIHGCLEVRARISIVYERPLIRGKLDFATQYD